MKVEFSAERVKEAACRAFRVWLEGPDGNLGTLPPALRTDIGLAVAQEIQFKTVIHDVADRPKPKSTKRKKIGSTRSKEVSSGGRKARSMTPAERKAVGKRMRKYWAARRKAKE